MSTTTIYTHPDGHEITVGDGLLTACTSDGFALSMPIGPAGLRDVAAKLLALADADEADAAERAGAALGGELLAEKVLDLVAGKAVDSRAMPVELIVRES